MIRMLGHREAMRAIEAVGAALEQRRDAAVVSVCDAQGELVALLRLDAAPVSAIRVAINKAYTAARLRRPSHTVGDALRDPARGVSAGFYRDSRIVGWAGGLPVVADGATIGAIGVAAVEAAAVDPGTA